MQVQLNRCLGGRGLSLFATGTYGRLSGDFKRSPIVDDRGSATQWLAAAGLGYMF